MKVLKWILSGVLVFIAGFFTGMVYNEKQNTSDEEEMTLEDLGIYHEKEDD